jgi:thiamine biosynthesis lipoprotein ApbE
MEADALSTAVFVEKPAVGVRLADRLTNTECLIIDRDGRKFRSRGWKSFTETQMNG